MGSQFPERSRPSCLSMDDSSDCLAWTDQHEVGKLGLGTVGEQDIVYAPSGRVKVSVPYWAKLKGSLVFLTIEPTVQFMDRQVSLMKAELDAAKQAAEDSCHLVFETQQEAAQKAYDVDPTQQDMSYGSSSDASFVGGKYVGRYADPDEGRGGGGGDGGWAYVPLQIVTACLCPKHNHHITAIEAIHIHPLKLGKLGKPYVEEL